MLRMLWALFATLRDYNWINKRMWGKEKFLKEFFLPPHPYPFKNFNEWVIFMV